MSIRHQFQARAALHFAFLTVLFMPLPSHAQQTSAPPPSADLTQMNIEDLMKVEVTSVSRQQQSLSKTAAAVFVITQDDIQRSGATNIPDLLRMVPGVQVAQINANSWAISVRGLNGLFSNDVVVMVDGRTVYVPTFGGVFWDSLDLPLEDIARIEVIRGPAGTVWGANAVNGLVNIITKKASETQGALVVAGAGGTDREFSTLQYGGHVGNSFDYRAYTKYFNEESLESPSGGSMDDGWHSLRGGFRADDTVTANDTLTFQGDIYSNRKGAATTYLPSLESPVPVPVYQQVDFSGGFFQTFWNHTISDRSSTQLDVSFDRYTRLDALGETRDTLDIQFQHDFAWGTRQDIVWGLEYRYSSYDTRGSLLVSMDPASRSYNIYSGFVQDEFAILPDKLYFTIGTKLEQHYYSGLLPMPSARLAWTPDAKNTLWASVSLAEETPPDVDVSLRNNLGGTPGPGGTLLELEVLGNPDLETENLLAYEAGYRASLTKKLSLDLALFYNHYDNEITTDPGTPFFTATPAPPHLVLPLIYHSLMHGDSQGAEIFSDWRVNEHWILSPGYAFEDIHMHLEPDTHDTAAVSAAQGSSPVNSAQLRSHYVLPRGFSWDASAFYVGRLADPVIPSYTRLDTQLNWQCREGLVFSVVGQNLLKQNHLEFIDSLEIARSSLMQRTGYAKLTWHF
jgi:iron complex outermembrane recepter protein